MLAAIASASVGVALFGVAVFLSQYLQISRGESPTASGLLTIPMMVGILISSTLVGRRISKTGRYKKFMVTGAALLTAGLALMGMLDEHTSLVELGFFMSLVGLGVGMVMQNLVLVVQNSVPLSDVGAASALVTFSRSLGGATGVSVLGAILGSRASRPDRRRPLGARHRRRRPWWWRRVDTGRWVAVPARSKPWSSTPTRAAPPRSSWSPRR